MFIYLVRHGEARSDGPDSQRGLTPEGEENVRRAGSSLQRLGVAPAEIRHSGKLRAQQTAAVLSEYIAAGIAAVETPGMSPNDDPAAIAEGLAHETVESVMLVSHLPFLTRLASLLVCGEASLEAFDFDPAQVVCLRSDGEGRWKVAWSYRF